MGLFLGAFLASSYCCVGAGGGYCSATASGTQVAHGQIAADWNVLPPGSRVLVEGYGEATVTDGGGDIQGNRIDVYYRDCEQSRQWGRRWVAVSLLGAVSVDPPWSEELDVVRYWHPDSELPAGGAFVTKTTYWTNRGVVDVFVVEGA